MIASAEPTRGEVSAPGPQPGDDVLELYGRCKALTLAAGATLLLERRDPSLLGDALALAREAEARPARSDRERAQMAGLRDAALALAALVEDPAGAGSDALLAARAAQRELRLALGPRIAAHFAPCGAHPHQNTEAPGA